MLLFRLCRARFTTLDGEGARLYGGRWNSAGLPAVYMSTTRALAALEYLIHVDVADVPDDLVLLALDVPDASSATRVDRATLPARWEEAPDQPDCRARGDSWLRDGRDLLLRVPAAPVPEEENVLLNPRHLDIARVRVVDHRPFYYDPRLLRP